MTPSRGEAGRGAPSASRAVLVGTATWGFASGINGAAAPGIAESFGVGDRDLALALGGIGLASLGALAVGRIGDRAGRRRTALLCLGLLPLACLAAALAPSLTLYVVAQMAVYALGTSLLSLLIVVMTEERSPSDRSRGQGQIGSVFTAFAVLPLLIYGVMDHGPGRWRLLWAAALLPALALPWLRRHLPETRLWRDHRAEGRGPRGSLLSIFGASSRRRALAVLGLAALVSGVEIACRIWLFYRPVTGLGMPVRQAVAILVGGGAIGMVGFWAGARLCESWGRRGTLSLGALVCALGAGVYYGSPAAWARAHPIALAGAFAVLAAGGNACLVAFRALATEVVGTRMRALMAGWMTAASALGWWGALTATGALAGSMGGVGPAVAVVIAVAVPAVWTLVTLLPETAGLELVPAAGEGPAAVAPMGRWDPPSVAGAEGRGGGGPEPGRSRPDAPPAAASARSRRDPGLGLGPPPHP